jgi:aminoglycoside phosphotransferase (APT) family kinase protein
MQINRPKHHLHERIHPTKGPHTHPPRIPQWKFDTPPVTTMTNSTPPADTRISTDLVHALVKEFIPQLADEPITFQESGWDNEMHRVGDDHVLRLPRRAQAAELVRNEQRWLPELAPNLPLTTPVPVFAGKPSLGYPFAWSLLPWLKGVPLVHSPALAQDKLVDDLASFLNALHVPAPDDAPENPFRGIPLAERDDKMRTYAADCGELIDHDRVIELWEELSDAPVWGGEDLWLHGDLHPLNLLVRGGRLSAVIDFGDLTSGDPATDLGVAWMLFDAEGRAAFRKALHIDGHTVDIHTWTRARGWALSFAVTVLAHSDGAPAMRRMGLATMSQVLG